MSATRRFVAALSILTGLALAALPAGSLAQEPGPSPEPMWDEAGPDTADPAAMDDPMDEAMAAHHLGPGGPEARMRMRNGRMGMLRDLDLTKEQRDKIADLHQKQARASIRMRADLQTAHLDLGELMRSERPDRPAIAKQIDKIGQLRAEMQKARVNTMLDVRSVLTPEQQQKVRERMGH